MARSLEKSSKITIRWFFLLKIRSKYVILPISRAHLPLEKSIAKKINPNSLFGWFRLTKQTAKLILTLRLTIQLGENVTLEIFSILSTS